MAALEGIAHLLIRAGMLIALGQPRIAIRPCQVQLGAVEATPQFVLRVPICRNGVDVERRHRKIEPVADAGRNGDRQRRGSVERHDARPANGSAMPAHVVQAQDQDAGQRNQIVVVRDMDMHTAQDASPAVNGVPLDGMAADIPRLAKDLREAAAFVRVGLQRLNMNARRQEIVGDHHETAATPGQRRPTTIAVATISVSQWHATISYGRPTRPSRDWSCTVWLRMQSFAGKPLRVLPRKTVMNKEIINPPGVYEHPAFARVVTIQNPGKLIFIAGQTPSDENYDPVAPGDYRAQYIKVMDNLGIQLAAAGASWDDVVFRRIFVLDVDAYIRMIRSPGLPVYYTPGRMPPSTTVGVTRLSKPEFLIEIDLMAVVG
ncbi:RidA family protein [Reyranella sp. CPCC 100927]|nr:RidA family protein [Reyranella sp. CPCC 100927]